jgi:hypothetical protein
LPICWRLHLHLDILSNTCLIFSSKQKSSSSSSSKRRLKKTTSTKSAAEHVKTRKTTIIAMSVTVVFFLSFLPHLSLITARIVNKDFDQQLRGASLVFYNIFLR